VPYQVAVHPLLRHPLIEKLALVLRQKDLRHLAQSRQRGMNFRLREKASTILISLRPGAPYVDRMEDDGRALIYEGHDIANTANGTHPKQVDQPERNPGGSLTQNGLFAEAAQKYKEGKAPPERVRVYEKIRSGIWVQRSI
jgi:hypothetical protein